MGKDNPIYDFPRRSLSTFSSRMLSQRKWWDPCCLTHLNPIYAMCWPLFHIESPSAQRWGQHWSPVPPFLQFKLHRYLQLILGTCSNLTVSRKRCFSQFTWRHLTGKKPFNWHFFFSVAFKYQASWIPTAPVNLISMPFPEPIVYNHPVLELHLSPKSGCDCLSSLALHVQKWIIPRYLGCSHFVKGS